MGKDKRPKAAFHPTSSKTPRRAENPESFYDVYPSWRFARLELTPPFGWHKLEAATLLHIHDKLRSFESMTWREILLQSNNNHHEIPTSQLCKAARVRLADLGLDDLEQLLSLRLTGPERVWGILLDGIVTLLWWDPDHQVYPVFKKHT